jgi:iron complex transport system substrate-binding protein
MEKVLEWNPDMLIIDFGSPAEVYDSPKWKSINAVKNKKVFKQPIGIFIWDRPTAESAVLHPLWLAKMAYPDRFADIDLVREIKKFYRETMSFDLTDEHAEAILAAKYTLSFSGQGSGK